MTGGNTRDDIESGEKIDIVVKVTGIDTEVPSDAIGKSVKLEDIKGQPLSLTIFEDGAYIDYEWEIGRWYRFQNAGGYVNSGYKTLNPSYGDLDVEHLETPPEDRDIASDSNTSDSRTDASTRSDQSSRGTSSTASVHGRDLQRGNLLLQFPLSETIDELDVHEYRLRIPSGFEGDPMELTSIAKSRFRYQSDGPVESNGPMRLYSVNRLTDSLQIEGVTVHPKHDGTTTLESRHVDQRKTIEELVKQDVKSALWWDYDVIGINKVLEKEPTLVSRSGDFSATQKYEVKTWVDPDGTVVLGVLTKYHLQSEFTLDEFRERGFEIEGVSVEHDTRVYDNASSGTVVGESETRYTDIVDEIGGISVATFHESRERVDGETIDQVKDQNPRLVKVDYGGGSSARFQAPQYLRVSPRLELLKAIDKSFFEKFHGESRMLPQERFSKGMEFARSIGTLPCLGIDVIPIPCNNCYTESAVDKNRSNFLYANGNQGNYASRDLSTYGVHKQPPSFDILAIYPERFAQEAAGFVDALEAKLKEYGAPPDGIDKERYDLGGEFDYTLVANRADEYDAVLAVVPDPDVLPSEITDPFSHFKRQFGQDGVPSQMVKQTNLDDRYILPNVAVGLIGGCGGIPWRIADMPGGADCFVGLDVTYDHETGQHIGASANIVYADGTLIASRSHSLQKGESFEIDDIKDIIRDLLRAFVKQEGRQPDHVVLHRDGRFFVDIEELTEELKPLGCKLDFVEVRKSGAPRIGEYTGDKFQVAEKGVGMLCDNGNHAILATTGRPELKAGNQVGTPRTLCVVKRGGSTDLDTLAKQVYWLSEAHIGSVSRSARLPITTFYADKCAEQAREGYVVDGELIEGAPYL